jgi:hypothetical protein
MKNQFFKPHWFLIFFVSIAAVLVNCKNDEDPEPSPKEPEITSFSPESGVEGTTVTITGKNFSTTASENDVKFNGTAATASASTATSITVTVPAGATTGKITVTVNGSTATSAQDFTLPDPAVTSFDPAYGLPGAAVTITGSNFSSTTASNLVKFGDVVATVTAASSTQLTVTVPNGSVTGKISVNVGGRNAVSANDFEVLKDIPRTGLIAFYPFKGNANDASGNSLNGTVTGATLATDRFGKANQTYFFDGTDDYISMGNPSKLQINTSITIAGWININTVNSDKTMQAIITKIFFDPAAGGNPTRGYFIKQDFMSEDIKLTAHSYSSEGLILSNYVSNALTLDTWVFIALTIDDKTWNFYQDGESIIGTTGSNALLDDGSKGDLVIGRYGGGFYFDGMVDDITIYNRALSATEVQQLYEQTVTKY